MRHDEQFFEKFYQDSYCRTVALVAAITGSRHEAEDAAQQAYARALARWSRLRGHDLPEAWVRKVALWLAAHRRPAGPEPADDLRHTPLGGALLGLPLHRRQVIVLHYFANLPVYVIAAECGESVGAVKLRLVVARRHLEQQLTSRPGGVVMQDCELRDQFEEWAEPLRTTPAPAVAALRSRIRRRTARTAAATGFALAVVGLVAGLLVAGDRAATGKPGGPAFQAQGLAHLTPPGQP